MPVVPEAGALRANLAFTCAKEADRLPALNMEADQLFKYARWLDKQYGEIHYDEMARYYRIAAAHGHYKANSNLQTLVSQGQVDSPNPSKETVMLAQQLIDAGIPGGYYDMARYLEIGYGVKRDHEKALKYYRKAADLGSPDAQYYVAEKLAPINIAPEIAKQMRQCATNQGYGIAAHSLGIDLQVDELYSEAVQSFQKGVAAGDTSSAYYLENAFGASSSPNDFYYLDLPKDLQRSERYDKIWQFLHDNESKNPKIPDIDQIVPLPPAKLPDWDGTFQWQKEQDAAIPPTKPDEKLVERLAAEKYLDPFTGLPIPRMPLGTLAPTGEACPESGTWLYSPYFAPRQVMLSKGEIMPPIQFSVARSYALVPELVEAVLMSLNCWPTVVVAHSVMWQLVAYPEIGKGSGAARVS